MRTDFRHELLAGIRKNELRAFEVEHQFRLEHYSPHLWATVTFRYDIKSSRALWLLETALVRIGRQLKSHLFWFCWYDRQPQRGMDGKDYTHFHIFIEIENCTPIKKQLCELLVQKFDGDVEVDTFDPERSAIYYSVKKHKGFAEGISCPRHKRMCNKRDRICGYVWKRELFANRNRCY